MSDSGTGWIRVPGSCRAASVNASPSHAIVGEPSLVLADEPTGNLDSRTGADIMSAFHDLHRAGSTIVLISHDTALTASLPRCVSLLDGRIVDDREPASVAASA